jgi:hypothetical protein
MVEYLVLDMAVKGHIARALGNFVEGLRRGATAAGRGPTLEPIVCCPKQLQPPSVDGVCRDIGEALLGELIPMGEQFDDVGIVPPVGQGSSSLVQ